MTLEIFYTPKTRGTRARWMAEELRAAIGLEHTLHRVDLSGDRSAYRDVHPLGQVPAIRVDGLVLFESQAILLWLADRYPGAELAPSPTAPERMRYYQWMAYGIGSTEPAAFRVFVTEPESDARAKALAALGDVLRVLDTELASGGPWILGARFSAADILLGGQVEWAERMGWLGEMPALTAYAAQVRARPAFVAAEGE